MMNLYQSFVSYLSSTPKAITSAVNRARYTALWSFFTLNVLAIMLIVTNLATKDYFVYYNAILYLIISKIVPFAAVLYIANNNRFETVISLGCLVYQTSILFDILVFFGHFQLQHYLYSPVLVVTVASGILLRLRPWTSRFIISIMITILFFIVYGRSSFQNYISEDAKVISETQFWLSCLHILSFLIVLHFYSKINEARQQAIVEDRDHTDMLSNTQAEFVTNMTHELKTPINAILGLSELMMDDGKLSEENKHLARTVHSSALQLEELVSKVLRFSNNRGSKNIVLESVEFQVEKLVEEALLAFSGAAEGKGIRLFSHVQLPSDFYVMKGDSHRLRQILQNLIDNSIKFSEGGHTMVRVYPLSPPVSNESVDFYNNNNNNNNTVWMEFSIQDTGVGIAESSMQQLFKPFTQADNSSTRKYGGAGLGLAISKQLIDLMGGRVSVTSAVGTGTTVSFSIPLVRGRRLSIAPWLSKSKSLRSNALIVTDHDVLRDVMISYSSEVSFFNITTCKTNESMQVMQRKRPDIVILDLGHLSQTNIKSFDAIHPIFSALSPKQTQEIKFVFLVPYRQMSQIRALCADATRPLEMPIMCYLNPLQRAKVCSALWELVEDCKEINEPSSPPMPSRLSSQDLLNEGRKQKTLKILLAEDNHVNVEVTLRQLSRLGYSNVVVANNGKEAAEMFEKSFFDLVLMDCNMPVCDGYESTRLIRRIETHQNRSRVTIAALTASTLPHEKNLVIECGMDVHIPKPLRLQSLKDLVESLEIK